MHQGLLADRPGPNDRGLSRKHIMESAHASLRRLQTDYIDLYQAHRYDHETPLAETMRAFDDLVRQGKVLYIGVSEWRAEEIAAALRIADEMGFDRLVSNQPQYNMIWRVIESEVIPLSEREGVGQIVWSPIAQGVLTGKYQPGQPVPAGSRATDPSGAGFIQRLLDDAVLRRVADLAPIAADAGLSMAQLAVAWVLQNRNVSAAIIGATRPEQVRENVKASGVRARPRPAQAHRRSARPGHPARPGPDPEPAIAAPQPRPSVGQPASGCRLIGPYSIRPSSSRVTWSTPLASRSRQFSPSQLSASPWLLNVSRGIPRDGTRLPSACSNCQLQAMLVTASVKIRA